MKTRPCFLPVGLAAAPAPSSLPTTEPRHVFMRQINGELARDDREQDVISARRCDCVSKSGSSGLVPEIVEHACGGEVEPKIAVDPSTEALVEAGEEGRALRSRVPSAVSEHILQAFSPRRSDESIDECRKVVVNVHPFTQHQSLTLSLSLRRTSFGQSETAGWAAATGVNAPCVSASSGSEPRRHPCQTSSTSAAPAACAARASRTATARHQGSPAAASVATRRRDPPPRARA
jgi:hypothetical protein